MTSSLSTFLRFLLWVSALAVLVGHLRAFLFVPYPHVQSPGFLLKLFYLLTGFGHEAVMVFFVLSGYLVGSGVVEKVRAGVFSWKPYLVNRISRLYPVLLGTLLLAWLLDCIGRHFFNAAGLYTVT